MPLVFVQLAAILGIALLISVVVKKFGQPPVIGYIITGIIVGPAILGLVKPNDAITSFGQIGVALLLFVVGLGLKPEMIKEVGRPAVLAGLGQIIFTTVFGLAIAAALGYGMREGLYLSVAFTFSSTIIILQLLYAKQEQDTLYGRIAIGFLLVQDIAALLVFLLLSSASASGVSFITFAALLMLKAVIIVLAVYALGRELLPRVDLAFARSREILFLFALASAFTLSVLFKFLGFSLELGALAAGVILSNSPYQREMAARLSNLRDFFLIMFFVVLGASISLEVIRQSLAPIIIFSTFILIGNPLIVIVLMRRLGYTLATSFYAGLTVAQISEFSLILLALGASLGHIHDDLIGLATMVGLLTIFVSTYFIMYNRRIFLAAEPFLKYLFGSGGSETGLPEDKQYQVALFGCHRLGTGIVEVLDELNLSCLVIDHNPETIRKLELKNTPCVFGSAEDISFLESLSLERCRAIISTVPDAETNVRLVQFARRLNPDIIILCAANYRKQALDLYAAGADYVIVPPYLGRRYIIELLRRHKVNSQGYQAEREIHQQELEYV